MTPLRIHTTIDTTGVAVIAANGDIDTDNVDALAATITATLTIPYVHRVVLDLDRVTFLDMAGLSDLLRARINAHHAGKTFQITHPHAGVRRVLDITGTTPLLTSEPCHDQPAAAGF